MCLVRAIFASRYQNPDRLAAQRDAGRIDHGRYGAEHRIRPSCVDVVLFPDMIHITAEMPQPPTVTSPGLPGAS